MEVAYFRFFFLKDGGPLSTNCPNVNIYFEQKHFVDSGHGIIRRDAFCFLLKSVSLRSLSEFWVNLYRRTPH